MCDMKFKEYPKAENVKIGDYVSYRLGAEFSNTGTVVYISDCLCVIRRDVSGVDVCVDFSKKGHTLVSVCRL